MKCNKNKTDGAASLWPGGQFDEDLDTFWTRAYFANNGVYGFTWNGWQKKTSSSAVSSSYCDMILNEAFNLSHKKK